MNHAAFGGTPTPRFGHGERRPRITQAQHLLDSKGRDRTRSDERAEDKVAHVLGASLRRTPCLERVARRRASSVSGNTRAGCSTSGGEGSAGRRTRHGGARDGRRGLPGAPPGLQPRPPAEEPRRRYDEIHRFGIVIHGDAGHLENLFRQALRSPYNCCPPGRPRSASRRSVRRRLTARTITAPRAGAGAVPRGALAFVPAVWTFVAPPPEPGLEPGPVPTFSVVIRDVSSGQDGGCRRASRRSIRPSLPYEVIVVDDGSTDGTADVLSGVSSTPITVLVQERDRGRVFLRRRCVPARAATGRLHLSPSTPTMCSGCHGVWKRSARSPSVAGLISTCS